MGKDNRPPKHLRTLKRGDVREDGMVFWAYHRDFASGEQWLTREKYISTLEAKQKYYSDTVKPARKNDPKVAAAHRKAMNKYQSKNREKLRKGQKAWYDRTKNDPEYVAQRRARQRQRRADDPQFRLGENLRGRVGSAIKKVDGTKCGKTLELTGCSIDELREHLESQFTEGMSWDNYGMYGWHIDHIKPCAKFDLTVDSEQRECFHYTNLQPLWAEDNLRKAAKYED